MTGLPDGTTMRVVTGSATAEEVAAALLALDAARRAQAPTARPSRPAWQLAARLEALGGRSMASPADLRSP